MTEIPEGETVFKGPEEFSDSSEKFIFNGGHFEEIKGVLSEEEMLSIETFKVDMSKGNQATFAAVPRSLLMELSKEHPQAVINGVYREIGTLYAKLEMLSDENLPPKMQARVREPNMQRYALDQIKNAKEILAHIQSSGVDLDSIDPKLRSEIAFVENRSDRISAIYNPPSSW